MHNPLKLNLYLDDELPKKKPEQKGGSINIELINNNKFKYLRANNVIETFIHGSSKIEENIELWFEFQNVNNINKEGNLSYMDRSDKSISFTILQLKKYSNVTVKNFTSNILVLKLIELDLKTIDSFIEEWKSNVKIFGNSIMDIYMYGDLYTKDNTFICNYIITKKYENYNSLLKLDYNQTMNYIIKILLFLQKCKENDIIFRNFKFSGIGYEFVNSEIQFVILDYEESSLIKKLDKYFNTFKDGCDAMCAGTLIPYFIIQDFFELEKGWKNKLDKLYSVGLGEILIFLLYTQDEIMDKFFKLIYNPSYLKSDLHYFQFKKLFDDEANKLYFLNLIVSLKPKFVDMDLKIINPMFIRIIQNCFDIDYNTVKSPSSYLEYITTVYSDYNKTKSSIKTFIKPIQTINYKSTLAHSEISALSTDSEHKKTTSLVEPTIKTLPVIKPVEPIEPVESVEPVEPIEPIIKPVEPIEPVIKPVEQDKPVEPIIKPITRIESVKPLITSEENLLDGGSDDMIYIGSSKPDSVSKTKIPLLNLSIGSEKLNLSEEINSRPVIKSVKRVGFLDNL